MRMRKSVVLHDNIPSWSHRGLSSPLLSLAVAATRSTTKSVQKATFLYKLGDKMVPQEKFDIKSEPEAKTKSRKERMAEYNDKCERILHYLKHGKHQDGLTKNQQRVVRGQAKNYSVDESSKYKAIFFSRFL